MRRPAIALALIMILGGATAYILFRLSRQNLRPTPVGWRAHVTTVAGDGSPAFRDAAQPTQAAFSDPFGIAVGLDGSLYVSDGGDNNRIRKIGPDGVVGTLAGGSEGFADGAGSSASFNSPSGIALDASGNIFVADTGNNRIRKINPQGMVSTLAGDGTAGYIDGPASQARFDGPTGIALDPSGNIVVADTYNDRIRLITSDGQVSTVAGAGRPGYADGDAGVALFDTPCGVVVTSDGAVIVADTGNYRLRKLSKDRKVTTLPVVFPPEARPDHLSKPLGLALTHDGFLYVTELERSRVVQIAPDGVARVVAGDGVGFGDGTAIARFNQPAGVAIDPGADRSGELYVADGGNYLVRKLARSSTEPLTPTLNEPLPRLTNATLGEPSLLWPLDPQERPHEVVATMGEVRGSFDSTDSRDHLHSGLDIFGAYGDAVRAVRSEKVTSPLANWSFGSINEGLRVGVVSYIHMQVGRNKEAKMFADPRFVPVQEGEGKDRKLTRVRIRRGTRFRPGDALGTVNRMYHVHLNIGPPGAEINPLSLSPVGFIDDVAPVIEKNGIQLFDEAGAQLAEKRAGRVLLSGRVRIVVDAFDRTNMNASRRRLGLYRLGYQILKPDGTPAPGFTEPRINIIFNRLPSDREATKLAYASASGITVYGSATTRFLYEVTNTVRDGLATPGLWDTSALPPGDYILRIIAADFSGNEAKENHDVLITITVK
ncbi:MAG TPA: NHL repeat-containing protein [Pyrinomonadaceae bacterium]|nr:NHL repeat-containing protein [Pyrinomonadaceae bacterium]